MTAPKHCVISGMTLASCSTNHTGPLIIPDGITNITDEALQSCTGLTSVHIPESVRRIGMFAFAGCTSLEEVRIPDGVSHIAECTFWECFALSRVHIPDGVTSIGDSAFRRCDALKHIEIPPSVKEIGAGAFDECPNLAAIVIPKGCTFVAFPESCLVFDSIDRYRRHVADQIVAKRLDDGVDVVGMHSPRVVDALVDPGEGRVI